jgi:hypothetical protein
MEYFANVYCLPSTRRIGDLLRACSSVLKPDSSPDV